MAEERDEVKTEEDIRLEDIFSRLEEINKKLESPEGGLEESFQLYKEGAALVKKAGEKIDLVEKQVQMITGDGETVPFEE